MPLEGVKPDCITVGRPCCYAHGLDRSALSRGAIGGGRDSEALTAGRRRLPGRATDTGPWPGSPGGPTGRPGTEATRPHESRYATSSASCAISRDRNGVGIGGEYNTRYNARKYCARIVNSIHPQLLCTIHPHPRGLGNEEWRPTHMVNRGHTDRPIRIGGLLMRQGDALMQIVVRYAGEDAEGIEVTIHVQVNPECDPHDYVNVFITSMERVIKDMRNAETKLIARENAERN